MISIGSFSRAEAYRIAAAAILATALSCKDPVGAERPAIDRREVRLQIGDTVRLNLVNDGAGTPVIWVRRDRAVIALTVTPSGRSVLVLGTAVGSTWIQATTESGRDSVPVRVTGNQFIAATVDAGAGTCATDITRKVYCWGISMWPRDPSGAYVFGPMWAPAALGGPPSVVQTAVGHQFGCVLTTAGQVSCWGYGSVGVLGSGSTESQPTPIPIAAATSHTAVAAGAFMACALTIDSRVQCWGSDLYGQLGRGVNTERCGDEPCGKTPLDVAGDYRFDGIEPGAYHACAVTSAGETYCWGLNDHWQLGDTTARSLCRDFLGDKYCSRLPVRVANAPEFVELALGSAHTCGRTREGNVYCWGDRTFGQTGTGIGQPTSRPTRVSASTPFASIAAGSNTTCGTTAGGEVYCWGENTLGIAGVPPTQRCATGGTLIYCVLEPTRVQTNVKFAAITVGGFHACGLTTDGAVYCWGSNSDGQIGLGAPYPRQEFEPARVYGTGGG